MNAINRKTFLKLLCMSAVGFPVLPVWAMDVDKLRADRVGWARLKTTDPWWMRHADGDPALMRFLREQTTLNIDPKWHSADVEDPSEMYKFPLLFSQSIRVVQDAAGRTNLAEYLRRGGFLLVDACCNRDINADFDVFLREHIKTLAAILPEAQVLPLVASHDIYRCFFQIPDGHPPHTYFNNIYNPQKARLGLYGVMIGTRMAGLVSLSGLQCGWSHMIAPAGHDTACMRMLVNIYVCAMMQGS